MEKLKSTTVDLKEEEFDVDAMLKQWTEDAANELRKGIDKEVFRELLERQRQETKKKVKKLIDADEELPDWAIDFLAEEI